MVAMTLMVWSAVFLGSMYIAVVPIRKMRMKLQADTLEYFRKRMAINRGRDEVAPRVLIAEHEWQRNVEPDRIKAAWLRLTQHVGLNAKAIRLSDNFTTYFVHPVTSLTTFFFHFADFEGMAYRRKLNDASLIPPPQCRTLEEVLLILVRTQ